MALNHEEEAFLHRASSVDFVVINVVTKKPVLVVEVDGFAWHENNPVQVARGKSKDSILNRRGLRPLRLATNESGEEEKLRNELSAATAQM
ncbi:DUF2726 domain-containing protein [Rothia koreensis]|uniref:DUF2726 domain-containing protein n=1 Tax=Rothia koreensis TaxID=592378 RepID=UPI0037CBF60E